MRLIVRVMYIYIYIYLKKNSFRKTMVSLSLIITEVTVVASPIVDQSIEKLIRQDMRPVKDT